MAYLVFYYQRARLLESSAQSGAVSTATLVGWIWMNVVAVTNDGESVVLRVYAKIENGSGRVYMATTPRVGIYLQSSAETAYKVASRLSAFNINYHNVFLVVAANFTVDVVEPSAGASITILLVSVMRAQAIMSEASIGTREEQIAVGWTVLNRLYSGRYGNSIEYIVTSWYAHNQEHTEVIKTLAKDLLEGQIPDPTSGATHFFSPRGMPKEGEDTTGFDVDGLHQVPLDGQDIKVYFPSWAAPEKGVTITEDTTRYLTAQPIPNKLEWRNLAGIRTWYFMFYRPYTTQTSATIGSPVELRVYDTQGRVTGVMNGTIKTDIPGSVTSITP